MVKKRDLVRTIIPLLPQIQGYRRAPQSWMEAAEALGVKAGVAWADHVGYLSDGRKALGLALKVNGIPIVVIGIEDDPLVMIETFIHELLHHRLGDPANLIIQEGGEIAQINYQRESEKARNDRERKIEARGKALAAVAWEKYLERKKPLYQRPEWIQRDQTTMRLIAREEAIDILPEVIRI